MTESSDSRPQLSNLDIQRRILLALVDQAQKVSPDGFPENRYLDNGKLLERISFDQPIISDEAFQVSLQGLLEGSFVTRTQSADLVSYAITDAGSMALKADTSHIGADLMSASILRVRRIELVDNQERLRGVIDTANGEHPRLLFSDHQGQPRLLLGVLETGASIHVKNRDQSTGINISVDNNGGSTISLTGTSGQLQILIRLEENSEPTLAVFGKDGKPIMVTFDDRSQQSGTQV